MEDLDRELQAFRDRNRKRRSFDPTGVLKEFLKIQEAMWRNEIFVSEWNVKYETQQLGDRAECTGDFMLTVNMKRGNRS